jgi:hypothetical protein
MSDTPLGPGWWIASDGKWYPPQSQSPQPATQPPAVAGNPLPKYLWLGGAVAVIIGALLPWASVDTPFGSVSKNGTDGDGVITIVFGAAAAVLLIIRWNKARARGLTIGALVLSVLVGVIAVIDMVDVKSRFSDSPITVDASIGIGLWLTLLGALVAVAGTVLSLVRSG